MFDGRCSNSLTSSRLKSGPQAASLICTEIHTWRLLFFQTWHTGTYLPVLVIITLQTYSKERGILLHSQRISVLPHTQPFCCRRRLWNVDSTCQCLCTNVFPHSDNRLSTSQLLFCLTNRHGFRPLKTDSSLVLICLFLPAMEFHENLHDLAVKEGLKGRKLHKAVESFTWNITILKVRYSFTAGSTLVTTALLQHENPAAILRNVLLAKRLHHTHDQGRSEIRVSGLSQFSPWRLPVAVIGIQPVVIQLHDSSCRTGQHWFPSAAVMKNAHMEAWKHTRMAEMIPCGL